MKQTFHWNTKNNYHIKKFYLRVPLQKVNKLRAKLNNFLCYEYKNLLNAVEYSKITL
jgi:hypothetical protein